MAGRNHRNDSSKMKDLLQPEEQSSLSSPSTPSSSSSKPSSTPDKVSDKEMAGHDHQNDSSKMKEVSQPEEQAGCSSSLTASSSSSSSKPSSMCNVVDKGEAARTQREDGASSSCPLDSLKHLSQCDNKLGRLSFSRTHTVLVDVDVFNTGKLLVPLEGKDVWQSNVVKMPFSPSSFMIKSGLLRQLTQTKRWEVISQQLSALAKKKTASVNDVEDAIFKYNPKYKDQWSFEALYSFVKKEENHFPKLFPKMAELALSLPGYVKTAIPLLKRGHSASITLSQVQISSLLANAFFCTFPHRNATASNAEYHGFPSINFTKLLENWSERKKEKLRAVLHYFSVVTDENTKPRGLVTFERRCLKDTDMPKWRSCKETMNKLHVTSRGTIETEGTGLLQVDFASSWIGGGVLGSGLVQEEILFLINPELIVSRLFTEKLADNECLIVTGSQQFSRYSGFGDSFKWTGSHQDQLHRDEWARLKRRILAIDAMHYRQSRDQYNMINITRELNKAFCGFKGHDRDEPDIATGKWGCGAFNGDPQLKAVIQLMAAARAKRGLAFFTFKDEDLKLGLQRTHHLLVTEKTTVGNLYGLLEDYCAAQQASGRSHVDLFQFIRHNVRPSKSQL
ncbi:poly(ADP-ribose) glycohydrolase [Cebidichthys violaceus]|uniref:poly(ADP-ribose) glycohydrolase n=1 Tax=Cebidichthys violaceus TaxID=271503 RepID=UPI0035CBD756